MERIKNEPVLLYAALLDILSLGVAFGLHISTEQFAALSVVFSSVLALVFRNFTTPTRTLIRPDLRIVRSTEDK